MVNEIINQNKVDLRRIDTDIEKQKRAARCIPGPLCAINEGSVEEIGANIMPQKKVNKWE